MKWGRKRSTTANPHLISHVFPRSWLSMFKKTSDNTKPVTVNTNDRDKKIASLPSGSSWTEGRYHGGSDYSYWGLSSGADRCQLQHLKSVRYDSDDELEVTLHSPLCAIHGFKGFEGGEIVGRRAISELPQHVEVLQENYRFDREKESDKSKILKRRAMKDLKLRKMQQEAQEEKESELPRKLVAAVEKTTKSIEKDSYKLEPVKIIQTDKDYQKSEALKSEKQRGSCTTNSNSRITQESRAFGTRNMKQDNAVSEKELLISEWQNMKELKISEVKLKNKEQKKTAGLHGESPKKIKRQVRKVRVYTPRTAARIECKIRALEDLKKAKMKTNKARKERSVKEATPFDSFAVVKSSLDPHEDFKISMAEMITAKCIRQPQELEELLACYLTLNCDEYHDLIIEVFRQVWFELNQVLFDPAIQSEHCCNDNH